VPHSRTLGLLLLWLALGLTVLEGLLFGLAASRKVIAPRRGRGLAVVVGVILAAYGWLTWTSWALWRASTPNSLAHWLASIHILVHDHTAGLAVIATGVIVLVLALVWVAMDLVGALMGPPPEHSRYEFVGITKQAKFAYGKTAITIAALLVAIQWPLHMDPGIQSILTTQVAIYVLLAMGLNVVVGFAGLLDSGMSRSGRSAPTPRPTSPALCPSNRRSSSTRSGSSRSPSWPRCSPVPCSELPRSGSEGTTWRS